MVASGVAEEIVDYLPLLSDEQQAAVLHVVKAFAEALPEPEVKVSEDYAKIIERRFQELQSGADPGVSWEEVRRKGRELLAKR
jgi:hypothetical protein